MTARSWTFKSSPGQFIRDAHLYFTFVSEFLLPIRLLISRLNLSDSLK